MTRVLQLMTRDEPGGVQVLATMVAEGLQARGTRVDTLALAGPGQSLLRSVWQILGGRYDAILSYQVAAGLVGGLVGKLASVPLRAAHLTAVPAAMRPHWRALDKLWGCLGLHTHIVANSKATASTVAGYPAAYRQRVWLIGHGVPPLPGPHEAGWRNRLGVPSAAPLLVASGRLAAQKDHATAIAALPSVPAAHLAIAGEGPLRGALLAQAAALGVADRLYLMGNLDPAQLSGLLQAADLYVFASLWESFGLAVIEAGLAGKPIVAADLPVLREVLAPAVAHGTVRFFPVGDDAALGSAIAAMLAAYPDDERRHRAASDLGQAHAVSAMIDAYCRLLAAAPA